MRRWKRKGRVPAAGIGGGAAEVMDGGGGERRGGREDAEVDAPPEAPQVAQGRLPAAGVLLRPAA